ncbi:MAG TPA: hypothetical protein ACFCUC_15875 [Desulfobacterales bacterium]
MKRPYWKTIAMMGIALAVFLVGNSFAGAQLLQKGEWYLPETYPDGFHGWGYIDRLGEKEIVIDDGLYPLAKTVSFHTPDVSDVPASWFKHGDQVGFLQNARGEIISVWRFE